MRYRTIATLIISSFMTLGFIVLLVGSHTKKYQNVHEDVRKIIYFFGGASVLVLGGSISSICRERSQSKITAVFATLLRDPTCAEFSEYPFKQFINESAAATEDFPTDRELLIRIFAGNCTCDKLKLLIQYSYAQELFTCPEYQILWDALKDRFNPKAEDYLQHVTIFENSKPNIIGIAFWTNTYFTLSGFKVSADEISQGIVDLLQRCIISKEERYDLLRELLRDFNKQENIKATYRADILEYIVDKYFD